MAFDAFSPQTFAFLFVFNVWFSVLLVCIPNLSLPSPTPPPDPPRRRERWRARERERGEWGDGARRWGAIGQGLISPGGPCPPEVRGRPKCGQGLGPEIRPCPLEPRGGAILVTDGVCRKFRNQKGAFLVTDGVIAEVCYQKRQFLVTNGVRGREGTAVGRAAAAGRAQRRERRRRREGQQLSGCESGRY